jgi:indolepyruvate ferredoxin oxidoreductase, alpha subunit
MAHGIKALLSGNEAVARGAWEAGVSVGCGYPGTPSTEILEALSRQPDVWCEWAPNEKVALEVATGASLGGGRALATMKHVGLNVAADPLFSGAYMGVNGGLVIVSADDPGMHSSQNEQDNRFFARAARIPLLEPATPDEARRYTRAAFELSERFDTPVLLRTTTRLSHGRAAVMQEPQAPPRQHSYVRDPRRNVLLPAHARARHAEIEAVRMPALAAEAERWAERVEGHGDRAFITAGPAFLYVRETFPDAAVLKLGMTAPLPVTAIRAFAGAHGVVTVIEELEPFLEEQIRALGIRVEPRRLPRCGELSVELLRGAYGEADPAPRKVLPVLPARPPTLCAGCGHRHAFQVLKELDLIVAGDIGCYTLGALEPLGAMDACMNMGASIPMAHGLRRVLPAADAARVVSVIGDSTFFHSGIAGLLDIVHNGGGGTALILDNGTTAMTGHQDHPGVPATLTGVTTQAVDIVAVVRALGVRHVEVVDPYAADELKRAVMRGLETAEASVIVVRAPCVLREKRRLGETPHPASRECTECHACLDIGCPAIGVGDGGRVTIDETLCNGCGLCVQQCRGCNAGLDIERILALVDQGRYADALALVLDVNPLPAVSARVCPHPCSRPRTALGRELGAELAARHPGLVARFGDPAEPGRISVRAVEQYLGDLLIAEPDLVPIERPPVRHSAAIIGSGPAGLSAAWQLTRRGVGVTIYDAASAPGGVLRSGIPGFRLDREVLDAEIRRVLAGRVVYLPNVRVGVDVTFEDVRSRHDATIVAVGYGAPRRLELEGADDVRGIHAGTEFLRRFNSGEQVVVGRRVAVIGGGNTAIDCARVARRLGADVTIYYRRALTDMPAIADEIEAALAEGITIAPLMLPRRVISDDAQAVRQVEFVRMIQGEVDASGRRAPVPAPDSAHCVEADTVIVAVGEAADLTLLEETHLAGSNLDVGFTGRTAESDVFACGDVAFGYGTVTQSIASGRRVADGVVRFLRQRSQRS